LGFYTGDVQVDDGQVDYAQRIQARATTRGVAVHLLHKPPTRTEKNDAGDTSLCTMEGLRTLLSTAKTVFWRGEVNMMQSAAESAVNTAFIVETLAARADADGVTVLSGVEATAAVQRAGVDDRMSHISTNHESFEDLLLRKSLCGVDVLADK
jgi:phosphoglycerate kinase